MGFLEHCRSRYGDIFRATFIGGMDGIYVSTPELAREVCSLAAHDTDAAFREFYEPLLGSNSLFCLNGEAWARHRVL
jgi:cytochrome P450